MEISQTGSANRTMKWPLKKEKKKASRAVNEKSTVQDDRRVFAMLEVC